MKLLSVLALTLMSFVAGNLGLRNLKKKDPHSTGVTMKIFKGREEGDPDEVDLDVKLKSCKKSDKKCLKLLPDGEEVSKKKFMKKLAEDMMGEVEEEEEEEEEGNRKLEWYDSYYCDKWNCYWSSW